MKARLIRAGRALPRLTVRQALVRPFCFHELAASWRCPGGFPAAELLFRRGAFIAGRSSSGSAMSLDPADSAKRLAAGRAVELVRPGMRLGLGTGSTARHFV